MKIAIVGGGITGLSLGYYLTKKFHKVTVFEKEDRLGGLASVFDFEGTAIERFYHHFFSTDNDLIELISELKLSDKLTWSKSSMGFYARGKIFPFTSPLDLLLFPPVSFSSRIRLGLLTILSRSRKNWEELSSVPARDWLVGQIGEEAYKVIWEPLLASKFGKEVVPAAWVWGRLAARAGSRKLASERLGYLRGGLGHLFDALANKIGEVRLSSSINNISQLNAFDKIIFTMASPLVSQIVEINDPTPYHGNICVILKTKRPVSRYYWTSIGDPSLCFCAMIEQNNAFNDEKYGEYRIIYLSRYAAINDPFWDKSDKETIELFFNDLKKINPGAEYETAYVFRSRYAQPVPGLNYKIPSFTIEKGRIYMVNNAQIFPRDRGLNDSIGLAKAFSDIMEA